MSGPSRARRRRGDRRSAHVSVPPHQRRGPIWSRRARRDLGDLRAVVAACELCDASHCDRCRDAAECTVRSPFPFRDIRDNPTQSREQRHEFAGRV